MVSSEMLRSVALVITDVSEELSASFIRVTKIGELGTTLAVTATDAASVVHSSLILVALMMEALSSSETSVLARATRRNISEDTILLSALFACYLNITLNQLEAGSVRVSMRFVRHSGFHITTQSSHNLHWTVYSLYIWTSRCPLILELTNVPINKLRSP
jgi:hypothetical protein